MTEGPTFPAQEHFECTKLSTRLPRGSCGRRHEQSARARSGWRQGGQGVRSQVCAACEVGKAHAASQVAERWEDGAPVRVVSVSSLVRPKGVR